MLDSFGETQKDLLKFLLKRKSGITVDEATLHLNVTRTATKQHLIALENLGYIEVAGKNATGGRPSSLYRLSTKGLNLFPKQYSWFSELMLTSIAKEKSSKDLRKWFKHLAQKVAKDLKPDLKTLSADQKIQRISKVMNELNYEAQLKKKMDSALPSVEASNCVFHALATKHPEVCEFDLTLLKELSGMEVQHTSCMLHGTDSCQFSFKKINGKKNTKTAELTTAEKGDLL